MQRVTRIADRYELRDPLGRGGSASVHAAFDHQENRLVALKIAHDATLRERMHREALVGALVNHPNVCAVPDFGALPDGAPFLVMERLVGDTLRAELERRGRFAAQKAVLVARQLLAALDAVHFCGYVHRDVKPENVFLVRRRTRGALVKLLDLGACCPRSDAVACNDTHLTTAGLVIGTAGYMAPEQALGVRFFDARVDVFATGVVLYEMLAGVPAFAPEDADPHTVLRGVVRPRRFEPSIPRSLEDIVMCALERDPADRFASAWAFSAALDAERDLSAA